MSCCVRVGWLPLSHMLWKGGGQVCSDFLLHIIPALPRLCWRSFLYLSISDLPSLPLLLSVFLPAPILFSQYLFFYSVYSLLNAASFSFYSIWSLPHFPASHWFCDISLLSTTASLRMFICFYSKLQRCTGNKGIGLMPNEWLQGWIWVKMLLQEWVFKPLEKKYNCLGKCN